MTSRAGFYAIYVRDGLNGHDLGWSVEESDPPESDGRLADHGGGSDLKSPAFDAIRDRIEVEEIEPGTRVGTIWIDLDAWSWSVEVREE